VLNPTALRLRLVLKKELAYAQGPDGSWPGLDRGFASHIRGIKPWFPPDAMRYALGALRNRELRTGNRELGTGNREWRTGNREWRTGNRELGTQELMSG